MQVLAVLFGSLLLYKALGFAGVSVFASWGDSARFALATMFLFRKIGIIHEFKNAAYLRAICKRKYPAFS